MCILQPCHLVLGHFLIKNMVQTGILPWQNITFQHRNTWGRLKNEQLHRPCDTVQCRTYFCQYCQTKCNQTSNMTAWTKSQSLMWAAILRIAYIKQKTWTWGKSKITTNFSSKLRWWCMNSFGWYGVSTAPGVAKSLMSGCCWNGCPWQRRTWQVYVMPSTRPYRHIICSFLITCSHRYKRC